ncbi:MAG: hypothetical protein V4683_06120 [Bacteroidota bacterium]
MKSFVNTNIKILPPFFLVSILFYLLGFYYLSFIDLPKGDFYIPNDEFMIPDSGVFAWYGLPSRCMEWPATPMVFFYYFLIGFFTLKTFLLQTLSGHPNTNFFDLFDKQVYDYIVNKPSYLVYGRVFQSILVLLLSYLSFKKFRTSSLFSNNIGGLYLFFILLLSSHTLISTSSLVRPDAIAILLAVYLFSIALSKELEKTFGQILFISIFVLLVSFRTIYLFLLPVVVYLIFSRKNLIPVKKGILLLIFLVILLVAFNPYLFTNTFLFLKAFLGNILGKRNNSLATYYNNNFIFEQIIQNKFIPVYLIFSIVGIYYTLKEKAFDRIFYLLLVVCSLIYLQSVLTSPTLFTTHLAPLLPFFLFFAAIGISKLLLKKLSLFYISFLIIVASNLYVNFNLSRKGLFMNYFVATHYLKILKTYQSVAIPEQLDVLVASKRNKASFKYEYDLLNDPSKRANKLQNLYSFSDTAKSSYNNMLLRSFMFDEENIKSAAAFISYQQMTQDLPESKMVYLFDDHLEATKNSIVPLQSQRFDELQPLFEANQIDLILTKNKLEPFGFELVKQFNEGIGEPYFIYKKNGTIR